MVGEIEMEIGDCEPIKHRYIPPHDLPNPKEVGYGENQINNMLTRIFNKDKGSDKV